MSFNFEFFNMRELLNSIFNYFSISIESKKIETKLNIDTKIPFVIKNDHNRLLQVLLNIVGNAFKFTQKGKITIDVTLVQSHSLPFYPEKELIQISVIDTGAGMHPT